MKLFNAITAIALISTPTVTAAEGVNPKFHKSCENAKDYLGCIKAHTGETQSNDNGLDLFGMPKLKGYDYVPSPENNMVHYYKLDDNGENLHKIKVRGIYGRYMGVSGITRKYQQAIAATPGSTQTFGKAKTNCSGLYGSVTCTTTPAPSITLPGNPGRAGGVIQESFVSITDCLDLTRAFYLNNVLTSNWKKLNAIPENLKYNCTQMHRMMPMKWSKLAGGSPDEKDKKAVAKFLAKKTSSTKSNKVITRLEDLPGDWVEGDTDVSGKIYFIKKIGCNGSICTFNNARSDTKITAQVKVNCNTKMTLLLSDDTTKWDQLNPGSVLEYHANLVCTDGPLLSKFDREQKQIDRYRIDRYRN